MAGWETHEGRAVHLPLDDVDTDQLIPARFMSIPRSQGYGDHLMHDLRREGTGALDPAFPLNSMPHGTILIAGRNFGCGSSREAAVYALVDAGFRAVIAPSFGDIFAGNAVNNGLCPAQVDPAGIAQLADRANIPFTVSLSDRRITAGEVCVDFALDATWATKLINGWDDIDLTMQHLREIETYRAGLADTPWKRLQSGG